MKDAVAMINSPHWRGYCGLGSEITDGKADMREQVMFSEFTIMHASAYLDRSSSDTIVMRFLRKSKRRCTIAFMDPINGQAVRVASTCVLLWMNI